MPYNHSNLDSDEVLYYVEGDYKARKGIEVGSITAHPQGHSARTASRDHRSLARSRVDG